MADDYDPNVEPTMQAILRRLRAVPGTGNQARKQEALTALQSLLTAGFFEGGNVSELERRGSGITDEAGNELQNLLYGVNLGNRGRIFRNALMDDATQFNARGAFFSSARQDAQEQSLQGIQTNVNSVLNSAADRQRANLREQGGVVEGLQGDIISERERLLKARAGRELPGDYEVTTEQTSGGPQPAGTPGPEQRAAAQNGVTYGGGGSIFVNGKPAQYAFDPSTRPKVWSTIRQRFGSDVVSKRRGGGGFILVKPGA